jgi:hypothetical protein
MKCNFEGYENLGMNGQNCENTKPADQYESIYLIQYSCNKKRNVSKYF